MTRPIHRNPGWLVFVILLLCSITVHAIEIDQAQFVLVSENPHSAQSLGLQSIADVPADAWETRSLPDYWRASDRGHRDGAQLGGQGWYRLQTALSEELIATAYNWAIYVPKHSRVMAIYVNGKKIATTGNFSMPLSDNYVMPYLFPLHSSLLRSGNNVIYIRLAGYGFDEISLSKIYLDTEENLKSSYQLRYGLSVGVAQIGFYSMSVLGVLVFLFWLFRRKDRQYLWFSLTCLSGAVFSSNRIVTDFPIPILAEQQSVFYNASVSFFTLFSVMFLHRFSGVQLFRLERAYFALICAYIFVALIAPLDYARLASNIMHVVDAAFGMYVLYIIYSHRDQSVVFDRYVVLGLCCLAYALSFNDLMLRLVDRPYTNWLTLQWAPLLMYIAFVSLVLSRLFRTLTGFEQLTRDLQKRVDEKTQQIVELEKEQAVSDERRRIMFDLHDGIGGQLVNAVNYLHRHPSTDGILLNTVNTALQDLRFIVDSIDNNGPQEPGLLLGTFRERFEPIIEAQGIRLVWNVDESLSTTTLGPSAALNLLRVLQEAVTNVIKHARADTIWIRTTASTIEIEDNGIGVQIDESSGLGISSMRARASSLGMRLEVSATGSGTLVRLSLE